MTKTLRNNNMQRVLAGLLALFALGACLPAQAGEGKTRLDRFLKGLQSMEAPFAQSLVDPNQNVIEESEGRMYLSRPDRFRIEYVKPYEQLYVADGKRVWMYDKDLEQVTVRKQEMTLGNTPALLLSSTVPLEKSFRIEELGKHEGFVWLKLYPLKADSSFEYVRIAMEGDTLRAMEMVDGFAQTTRLYFKKVERNPKIGEDKFRFTPPPGVDVIGETQ